MEKQKIIDDAKAKIESLQKKIDETKVQLNLASKDAKDKIDTQLTEMEKHINSAKTKFKNFESSSEGALKDIQEGINTSVKALQESFDKAKQHFKEK